MMDDSSSHTPKYSDVKGYFIQHINSVNSGVQYLQGTLKFWMIIEDMERVLQPTVERDGGVDVFSDCCCVCVFFNSPWELLVQTSSR